MTDTNLKSRSKMTAEAWVSLTDEQKDELKDVIELWQEQKGLTLASLIQTVHGLKITFRTVPPEIGQRIIDIVDELYEGETQVEKNKVDAERLNCASRLKPSQTTSLTAASHQ